MLKTTIAAASIALMAGAGAVGAATLSLTGSSTTVTLGSNFNPTPGVGIGSGTDIEVFTAAVDGGSIGGGLTLSADSQLRFTFLGKEADFRNQVVELDATAPNQRINNTEAAGTSFTMFQTAGLIDFRFRTPGSQCATCPVQIRNGGNATTTAQDLGFYFDGGGWMAFYGDGGANNDQDYDDMIVRIEVVPVPAAGWLLLGGLGGLAALRRRKS